MRRSECAIWPQVDSRDGYAITWVHGRLFKVHRLLFSLLVGPIPKGKSVLHSCDNRACVNPAHLRLGTHAENMAEMFRKDRHSRGERSPTAKLNDDLVRHIRSSRKTLRELSIELGVSQTTLHMARRGISWRHVK